jgi:peptidoglycan/LPS O-acetylase OafA/YrhL
MKILPKQNPVTDKRLQVIDLVRAFAILIVLAHHLGLASISNPSHFFPPAYLWYRVWINGYFGVTIFFVVSGFVITRLIASESGGLFNPNFKEFYTRRVGRIFPLLILVCLVGVISISVFPVNSKSFAYIFKDPSTPIPPGFWASIATFSFNWYQVFSGYLHEKISAGMYWGVLWSLSIEEQFYLFYPFLLKNLRNKKNLIFFLIALIVLGPLCGKLFAIFFPGSSFGEKNSFGNFGFIAIGCLLYLISDHYKEFLSKNRKLCLQFCFIGLFLIGIFYWHIYVSVNYWWFFWEPPLFTLFAPTFLALGVFFFLLGGLHLNFFNSKHWSIISWIGKLSYGGYLYHSFVLYLLWQFFTGRNEWFNFFIFVAITFGLAELSYLYFEVPANLWIRKSLGRSKKKIPQ